VAIQAANCISRYNPAAVTFEDFRRSALDSYRRGADTWEKPEDAEALFLFAADDYGAFHIIPVPPFFLQHERGHVDWLDGALPNVVSNRSLQRVAFPGSAWASRHPNYDDRLRNDPNRPDLLKLHIAEKGRSEVWHAEIRRSRSGLAGIGDWQFYATEKDCPGGEVPRRLGIALQNRGGTKGPTMPAAYMVLGEWDVPQDYFPLTDHCGPLDQAVRENMTSTYISLFRSETSGLAIVSQAFVLTDREDRVGYVNRSVEALHDQGLKEFGGPPIGEWSHYVEGDSYGDTLYRYAALWRRANVFLEVAVAGPNGRFTKAHLFQYAAIQDKRARAVIDQLPSIAS
jgi:hypothetical protein